MMIVRSSVRLGDFMNLLSVASKAYFSILMGSSSELALNRMGFDCKILRESVSVPTDSATVPFWN